jgi:hypothetical protein
MVTAGVEPTGGTVTFTSGSCPPTGPTLGTVTVGSVTVGSVTVVAPVPGTVTLRSACAVVTTMPASASTLRAMGHLCDRATWMCSAGDRGG